MHSAPPSIPPRCAKWATPGCAPVTPKSSSSSAYPVTNSHAGTGIGIGTTMSFWRGKYQAKASSTPKTPPEAPMTGSAEPAEPCTASCVSAAASAHRR